MRSVSAPFSMFFVCIFACSTLNWLQVLPLSWQSYAVPKTVLSPECAEVAGGDQEDHEGSSLWGAVIVAEDGARRRRVWVQAGAPVCQRKQTAESHSLWDAPSGGDLVNEWQWLGGSQRTPRLIIKDRREWENRLDKIPHSVLDNSGATGTIMEILWRIECFNTYENVHIKGHKWPKLMRINAQDMIIKIYLR